MKHVIHNKEILVEVTPCEDDVPRVANGYPRTLRDFLDSFFDSRACIGNFEVVIESGDYHQDKDDNLQTEITNLEIDKAYVKMVYIFTDDEDKEIEVTDAISEFLIGYYAEEITETMQETLYEEL